MLTWAQITELPAFKALREAAQAVEALGNARANADIMLSRGDMTSERTNQYIKMLSSLRDRMIEHDLESEEVLALYAMTGSKGDLATDVAAAVSAADKYITEFDTFLTSKGLKSRVLSSQEAAELTTKLAATRGG